MSARQTVQLLESRHLGHSGRDIAVSSITARRRAQRVASRTAASHLNSWRPRLSDRSQAHPSQRVAPEFNGDQQRALPPAEVHARIRFCEGQDELTGCFRF